VSGTVHPPVEREWINRSGTLRTQVYARTHYRCRVCRLYFRDAADFVEHLTGQGECEGEQG
jgi:hypothetical protein